MDKILSFVLVSTNSDICFGWLQDEGQKAFADKKRLFIHSQEVVFSLLARLKRSESPDAVYRERTPPVSPSPCHVEALAKMEAPLGEGESRTNPPPFFLCALCALL